VLNFFLWPILCSFAEGKKNTISKADKAFLHHLSIRDARRHLPHLRSLAAREYPDTLVQGLVIGIDYRVTPEKYSVQSIVGYSPETTGTVNEEARNDALFEKARDNQDRYTLLETKIANGQDAQLVMTLCPSFWDKDAGLLDGNRRIEGVECISDDDDDNSNPKPALDEVDELMVRILYDIDPITIILICPCIGKADAHDFDSGYRKVRGLRKIGKPSYIS
jgi:hypothetical protein